MRFVLAAHAAAAFVMACWGVASPPVAWADEPDPAAIAGWIDQLGAPQFAQRESASRSLVEAGRPALEPLGRAIEAGDFEVASRAVEVVREFLASDDAALAADAERLLEQHAERAAGPMADLVESTLDYHLVGMAEAARERLEAQGAVIRERPLAMGQRGAIEIELGAAWQGGSEDLRQLPRLRGIDVVAFHGVRLEEDDVAVLGRLRGVRRIDLYGTGATPAAVAALRERLPDVLVDVRKGGKLGVSSLPLGGPCEITSVLPGSAADRAGIRAGDVVVTVDGEAIATFEALTARLSDRGPGDAVVLGVARSVNGGLPERFDCTVQLDAW